MLKILEKSKYEDLIDLLPEGFFPEVAGVLKDLNPGKVFVLTDSHPKSALIFCQGMGAFTLIGEPDNPPFIKALIAFLQGPVIDFLASYHIYWLELIGVTSSWNQLLDDNLMVLGLSKDDQLVYEGVAVSSPLMARGEMKILNEEAFLRQEAGYELLKKEIEDFWGSYRNFLAHGLGFSYEVDHKLVSFCYSGFVTEKGYALGIRTIDKFQGQGYGYELANLMGEYLANKGLWVHWDCSEDNLPSKKLAHKLGLQEVLRYPCYWREFP